MCLEPGRDVQLEFLDAREHGAERARVLHDDQLARPWADASELGLEPREECVTLRKRRSLMTEDDRAKSIRPLLRIRRFRAAFRADKLGELLRFGDRHIQTLAVKPTGTSICQPATYVHRQQVSQRDHKQRSNALRQQYEPHAIMNLVSSYTVLQMQKKPLQSGKG